MHIHTRLPIVAALLLVLIPLSAAQLGASLMEKHKAAQELDQALDAAEHATHSGRGVYGLQERAENNLEAARIALEDAEQHKNQARRKFVRVMQQIEELQEAYGVDATNSGALLARVEEELEEMTSFVKYLKQHTVFLAAGGPDFGVRLARSLLHTTLGDITDHTIRYNALMRARTRIVAVTYRAKVLGEQAEEYQAEYERQLVEFQKAWDAYVEAQDAVRTADDRIAQVQRITNEVQAQITKLQRELARIDAQLVAKLERELIEKGLMSAQPGERSDGRIRSKQTFRWPVVGKISAGFYSTAYKKFFGVAHKGVDIVVPQGTAVVSAADGVVYLARDGGKYGYSYVLVGHRDGMATLYGHLSSINVSSGQEVAAGSVLGLSGGTPGTYGAGPMTTGAHLHFEVIKGGSHIDPMTVLP